MAWFECTGGNSGGGGGELTPLDLTNEVHNIQSNRILTLSGNTIVCSISSWRDSVGLIAIPVGLSDGENVIVAKYDLQGYSRIDNTYYPTIFLDNNNTVSNIVQQSGSYQYFVQRIYQSDIAEGGSDDEGHIICLGIPPNVSGSLYLKINFGVTNFKSLSLFKIKL